MIDWKHPELAIETAKYLKDRNLSFHMDIIGGGELEEEVCSLIKELGVEDCVSLPGFRKPEEVRTYMEKADIYLVTSDREEGWGAVVNEAMNSGCAVVGNHMIGAVPYLIDPEKNGRIYHDKDEDMLFEQLYELCNDRNLCRRLGREAYRTIAQDWNPQMAAKRFLILLVRLGLLDEDRLDGIPAVSAGEDTSAFQTGPCSPAPVIGERAMRRLLDRKAEQNKKTRL